MQGCSSVFHSRKLKFRRWVNFRWGKPNFTLHRWKLSVILTGDISPKIYALYKDGPWNLQLSSQFQGLYKSMVLIQWRQWSILKSALSFRFITETLWKADSVVKRWRQWPVKFNLFLWFLQRFRRWSHQSGRGTTSPSLEINYFLSLFFSVCFDLLEILKYFTECIAHGLFKTCPIAGVDLCLFLGLVFVHDNVIENWAKILSREL